MRPIILKERPETKFIELGTIMGQRWRSISPQEKKKFEAMAHEDRIRFNLEMEVYNAKKEEAASVENFTLSQVSSTDQSQVYGQQNDQIHQQQLQQQQQQLQKLHQQQQQQIYYQQQDQIHYQQQMNQNHFQHFDPLQTTSSSNSTAFKTMQVHQDHMYEQQQQQEQYQQILESSVPPFDVSHAFDDSHLETSHAQYPSKAEGV